MFLSYELAKKVGSYLIKERMNLNDAIKNAYKAYIAGLRAY